MRIASACISAILAVLACRATVDAQPTPPTVEEARIFLARCNDALLASTVEFSRARWIAETYVNDDTEALAAIADSRRIAQVNQFIAESHRFDSIQLPPDLARQIMLLRTNARLAPSEPALRLETTELRAQLAGMYAKGKYCVGGDTRRCLGIDDLEVRMANSHDPKELLDLWTGWHSVGAPMRSKYARFVELSNQGARERGFADTGALWRSRYDMSDKEFSDELERTWKQLQPLYQEFHAYVRFKLIQKYGAAAERPDGLIPAHLLGNMWAQGWAGIGDIVMPSSAPSTYDPDEVLRRKIPNATSTDRDQQIDAAKALARLAESFYTSLGLDPLPETFYERSQFIRPRDREVDCQATGPAIDYDLDLRVRMCMHIDADGLDTLLHEMGHLQYQRAYRKLPFLFRDGANDGFHEAVSNLVYITPESLRQLRLIDTIPPAEADIPLLLGRALNELAFLPFSLLIDKWRWEVFSGRTKPEDYNNLWWALRAQYQGVAPPLTRTEADFDPGAKFHIPANTPYAGKYLATIYRLQLYKAMCDASGHKGPLIRCDFFGSKAAGTKLKSMLEAGASQPWQVTFKKMTGQDHLDANPLVEYYQPLYIWLKQQNALNSSRPGWQVPTNPMKGN
ncbi:MAG: M2 family metallopeptidase [Acidobacteria bacterium]|nr:M2 family metallopeptidase [Acidobacteriota bacterium]